MDSIDKNDDLELLAALLDGKLSGAERARAIQLLADSDEALELFASAARDERLAAESLAPRVIPIWRRWKVSVPIAAAAAITLAVMPRLVGMGGSAGFASEFAGELTNPRGSNGNKLVSLTPGWELRGWPENRGVSRVMSGTSQIGSSADAKRAFRLGVRTVDLQYALQRGDTGLAIRVLDDIRGTLSGVLFKEGVDATYADLASRLGTVSLAESMDRATSAEHELRALLRSPSFDSGQWIGAADLAAQEHNAVFFQSDHGVRFLRTTVLAGPLDSAARGTLRRVDSLLSQGLDDGTLNVVHDSLRKLIQVRGN